MFFVIGGFVEKLRHNMGILKRSLMPTELTGHDFSPYEA
jgi:hypothetical protein